MAASDEPLICVVMGEEILVGLDEAEADVLIENSALEPDDLSLLGGQLPSRGLCAAQWLADGR